MTLRLPTLAGRIDRRLLLNFRADPDVVARILPSPFEPQLVGGRSIVGICIIRLASARPSPLPRRLGITAEHVAHRIAVMLPSEIGPVPGVFIPRRDTDSAVVAKVGSRFFSGGLHRARSRVIEDDGHYHVELISDDRSTDVAVDATVGDSLPDGSVFRDLGASSAFFAEGAIGYSTGARPGCFDGVTLRTDRWSVRPLNVASVRSSFFDDRSRFPAGSIAFDHALVMTGIETRWTALPALAASAA